MDLKDMDLLKLQTQNMRLDDAVIGFSAALSDQFKKIAAEVRQIEVYSAIDRLPEEALDILAWQFGADWYDAKSHIEIKRQAIQDVLYLARIRGTPAAVQRVIEIYFGDGKIEEWFEYGGEPGYFRVRTTNQSATNERAQDFIRAVDAVKRLTAWLETVIIEETIQANDLYFGATLHIGDYITIG